MVLEDGERKKALSSTKRILASYLNGSRANQQNFSIIFALVDWQRKPDLPLAEKANSNEMGRRGTNWNFRTIWGVRIELKFSLLKLSTFHVRLCTGGFIRTLLEKHIKYKTINLMLLFFFRLFNKMR